MGAESVMPDTKNAGIKLTEFSELPEFRAPTIWSDRQWFECLLQEGPSAGLDSVGFYNHEGCVCLTAQGVALSSLTNYFSIRSDTAHFSASFLADLFRSCFLQKWSTVQLDYIVGEEEAQRIASQARMQGFKVIAEPRYENWYHRLEDGESFQSYISTRPKRLQNTLQRKQRKLQKLGAQARVWCQTADGGLDQLYEDFQTVYQNSWKGGEEYPQFVRNFAQICAERGILRLGLLYLSGEPVAAQFWVIDSGTAYVYKLAYDERFANLSVGSCLSQVMFEHVIDKDQVQFIDYGVGSESYKQDWMDNVRSVQRLHLYHPQTLIERLKYYLDLIRS